MTLPPQGIAAPVQVELPAPLCRLSGAPQRLTLQVIVPVTQRTILDALETAYPALRGTIRDQQSGVRRAFLRFFACGEDLSHASPDAPVPDEIALDREPFVVIGAIAGGT